MFNATIIIDADENDTGWELVARFGPEDMIAAVTDVPEDALDDALRALVGAARQEMLVLRDREKEEEVT